MYSFRTSACKRGAIVIAIALTEGLALAPLAVAQDASVRIAGQTVFTNKAASGGMSASQRAETIQKNLDNALVAAKDRSPASVNIVYVKGMPVITLGGYQVVTVDAANAKSENTTPALLAQKWADGLRQTLQDQPSIDSYVAQLSGNYPTNAPAPNTAPTQSSYNPPQQNYGGQPPQYGGGGQPPQYGGGGQPPQYGGGGQPPQYGGSAAYDQFNRSTGQPPQYGGGYAQGGGGYPPQGGGGYPPPGMQRGQVVYAPAGLTLPVALRTSISTQAAQAGDLIEANLSDSVSLGGASLPAGTVLVGQVTDAKAGGFMGRSGMLGVKFTSIRTPDGQQVPITAHVVGGIGKYADSNGDGIVAGETWKTKVGQGAIRGGLGAGLGAALGTGIGAIAARNGRGTGRGAWSGAAIGGGLGVADSLLLRKGKDVTIHSGTPMQVQLDAPVSLSGGGPYTGAF
jgi:hypothetical protein